MTLKQVVAPSPFPFSREKYLYGKYLYGKHLWEIGSILKGKYPVHNGKDVKQMRIAVERDEVTIPMLAKKPSACTESINTVCSVCPKMRVDEYNTGKESRCQMGFWTTKQMYNWRDSE